MSAYGSAASPTKGHNHNYYYYDNIIVIIVVDAGLS